MIVYRYADVDHLIKIIFVITTTTSKVAMIQYTTTTTTTNTTTTALLLIIPNTNFLIIKLFASHGKREFREKTYH